MTASRTAPSAAGFDALTFRPPGTAKTHHDPSVRLLFVCEVPPTVVRHSIAYGWDIGALSYH